MSTGLEVRRRGRFRTRRCLGIRPPRSDARPPEPCADECSGRKSSPTMDPCRWASTRGRRSARTSRAIRSFEAAGSAGSLSNRVCPIRRVPRSQIHRLPAFLDRQLDHRSISWRSPNPASEAPRRSLAAGRSACLFPRGSRSRDPLFLLRGFYRVESEARANPFETAGDECLVAARYAVLHIVPGHHGVDASRASVAA